jgi:hypothetical protein
MKRINMKCLFIVEQLKFGLMSKHKRKHVQFVFIFLSLSKHRSLTNYESFEVFFF